MPEFLWEHAILIIFTLSLASLAYWDRQKAQPKASFAGE